jgi:hypothetical protein
VRHVRIGETARPENVEGDERLDVDHLAGATGVDLPDLRVARLKRWLWLTSARPASRAARTICRHCSSVSLAGFSTMTWAPAPSAAVRESARRGVVTNHVGVLGLEHRPHVVYQRGMANRSAAAAAVAGERSQTARISTPSSSLRQARCCLAI